MAKMLKKRIVVVGLAAVLALGACSRPAEPKPEVILLHSGRMRGNVYPLSLQNISPLQHYQFLAGYVRAVREEAAKSGAKVFLVDLGDSLGGSFASHVTGSRNMVTFFNEAGYDAVMLSNLDADVPEEALAALKAKVLSPFLGPDGQAAVEGTSAGGKWDLGGLPVYLLANFYGDTDPAAAPGRFPEKFGPHAGGVAPVRDYPAVLQALGSRPAGALTLLAWMKFEPSEQVPEEFLRMLRENRIDAILAHRIYGSNEREAWQASGFVDWNPPVSLNILRNNAGFVLARMDMARVDGGWRVLRHELVPMTANAAPADGAVVAAVEAFSGAIRAADAPLGALAEPAGPEKILEIYMGALASVPETDAVAYSADSIRSDWPAGELRASTVFNSLPWTSGLFRITLDRARLDELGAMGSLRVAVAPVEAGGESGTVRLTTSQFFASLITRRLNLPPEAVEALPETSEFDFFVAYLQREPGALTGSPLSGWEILER